MTAERAAIEGEQRGLDEMFDRRDELLAMVERDLTRVAGADVESGRDLVEAQARVRHLSRRRGELARADRGLCFGRIEEESGERLHIGRIGLPSPDQDADPLLIDWRAPIARVFYTATAARPMGVRSRRHIRTEGRVVVGVDDERFDSGEASVPGDELVGEAALLAALDSRRTGRMGDVVATLQSEQDEIIRAHSSGCLVVQGGPGTGKTAVALHRAAYLLFSSERLVERGVLVVGPSPAFLDYIDQVLPSLGETQVVTTTTERLVPGIAATGADDPFTAEVKGRAVWADVLARLVGARWPVPTRLELSDGADVLVLEEEEVAEAVRSARTGGRSYHETGAVVRGRLVDRFARGLGERTQQLLTEAEEGFEEILASVDRAMGVDGDVGPRGSAVGSDVDGVTTEDELDALRERLAGDREVAAVLDRFWPLLDVPELLEQLLSDQALLAEMAPELTASERAAVRRDPSKEWTAADVALLDELAELVGWSGPASPDTQDTDDTDDVHDVEDSSDARRARDVVKAEVAPLADRALLDRRWAYGHVIVDEAQELSPMQWRMLVRRCPPRSFTVVGDVNQTEASAGTHSWDQVLAPLFGGRWRQADLSISYRTPRETMDRTVSVLAAAGSTVAPPRAVRSNGVEPWRRDVTEAQVGAAISGALQEFEERYAGGQFAVIAPQSRLAVLAPLVSGTVGARLLTPSDSKGLEFDAVIVVDPHEIVSVPRGWNALYVAMTRCTQELGLIAFGPGPAELAWP